MAVCVFCEVIAGRRPGVFLHRDSEVVAFMDRYPIDDGHSLVVPVEHHERLTDMDPASVGAVFGRVPGLARAILAGTGADAFNVAQNNGWAAKQVVPHVHVHIIPRFSGRSTVWTSRKITDIPGLEKTAARIRACM